MPTPSHSPQCLLQASRRHRAGALTAAAPSYAINPAAVKSGAPT